MPYKEPAPLKLESGELNALTDSVLGNGTVITFKAGGQSMWPFIKNMDTVTLAPVSGRHIGMGEVVGYIHPGTGRFLIHRVIKKVTCFYYIKGDNCREADGWIEMNRVKGVLISINRDGLPVYSGLRYKLIIAVFSRLHILIPVVKQVAVVLRRIKR